MQQSTDSFRNSTAVRAVHLSIKTAIAKLRAVGIAQDRFIFALIVFNLLVALYLTIRGLLSESSFWLDEVFTVSSSAMPLSQMSEIALKDNHPPLYPYFLHAWLRVSPATEFAARLPSAIFSAATVIIFARLRTTLPRTIVLCGMFLLTCSAWWVYYAQEARGYGLGIMLSTLCMVLFIKKRPMLLILSCVALGLNHFFGTLLASIYLAWLFFFFAPTIRQRVAIGIAQVIITTYPVYHLVLGTGGKLAGNFWINHGVGAGIVTALETEFVWFSQVLFGTLRILGLSREDITTTYIVSYISIGTILLSIGALALKQIRTSHDLFSHNDKAIARSLIVISTIVIVIITVISLHTPMVQHRNYTILLPIGSILGSYFLYPLLSGSSKNKLIGLIILGWICITASEYYVNSLVKKWYPADNFRQMAAETSQISKQNQSGSYYIREPTWTLLSKGEEATLQFYSSTDSKPEGIDLEQVGDLPKGAVVSVRSGLCSTENKTKSNRIMKHLLEHDISVRIHRLKQSNKCGLGYFVIQ